tara:strand:+ start:1644 stop:2531 length:888 start_codon:yes stop_codon:yes gene_type:complete
MHFNSYSGLIISSFLVFLISFQNVVTDQNDFERDKELIVLRKIGHQILLQSGDTTSRVLPVKKLSESEFQLQFESNFTFQPDSLVNIVGRIVEKNGLSPDYIVNVIECSTGQVIYGYAILGTEQSDIVPCSGRVQPKSCYFINLRFQKTPVASKENKYVATAISLLGLTALIFTVGFYIRGRNRKQRSEKNSELAHNSDSQMGRYFFSFEERYLLIDGDKTELTYKESRILNIFAKKPNQIIDREILQKEVWEDEGVIVGRSLDMYISKLRKKLKYDSSIELVNIHGKGYKLQII